jgi:hypothetical protein
MRDRACKGASGGLELEDIDLQLQLTSPDIYSALMYFHGMVFIGPGSHEVVP